MDKVINYLDTNPTFTVLCGIATLIGFFITIYISLKTKSIKNALLEYKQNQRIQEEVNTFVASLTEYQDAVRIKKSNIRKLKDSILNDVNRIIEFNNKILTFKEKIILLHLKLHLEKEQGHNANFICNSLSKIIACLQKGR